MMEKASISLFNMLQTDRKNSKKLTYGYINDRMENETFIPKGKAPLNYVSYGKLNITREEAEKPYLHLIFRRPI